MGAPESQGRYGTNRHVQCDKCWTVIDREKYTYRRFWMACPRCRSMIGLPDRDLIGSRGDRIDQENCRHCGTMKEIGQNCPGCGKR